MEIRETGTSDKGADVTMCDLVAQLEGMTHKRDQNLSKIERNNREYCRFQSRLILRYIKYLWGFYSVELHSPWNQIELQRIGKLSISLINGRSWKGIESYW